MSLWEARLSTEHVGRYMDCGVGSSDLEYMKCSETGLWGQRALYNKYTRWRTGAYRLGTPGRESIWTCLKDLHTSLLGHPEL